MSASPTPCALCGAEPIGRSHHWVQHDQVDCPIPESWRDEFIDINEWNALNAAIEKAKASAVREAEEPLLAAINWALGCNGRWKFRPEGAGPYWWRAELSSRAGLKYDSAVEKFIAAHRGEEGA